MDFYTKSIDAAIEGSYMKALMALTMSKTVKSAFQAKQIKNFFQNLSNK